MLFGNNMKYIFTFLLTLYCTTLLGADGGLSTVSGTTTLGGSATYSSITGATLVVTGNWDGSLATNLYPTNLNLIIGNGLLGTTNNGILTVSAAATPGAVLTNGNSTAVTFSNNVGVDITHTLSVSNLTPSRVVLTTAGDALSSAAASGAVPINADGSATTFAQVSALGLRAAGVAGFQGATAFVTTTKFISPFGANTQVATTEANISQNMPFSCTWSNLYARFNSLGSGTNVVITVVTNGVASNLSISVNGLNGLTTANDTAHGVPVALGATVTFSILGTNPSVNANNVMVTCAIFQ